MPRRLQATGGWWVAGRAEGVYKSMIAAGATPEQAQKAVEMVYIEEEQRLAAEQRYLDWVRGVGAKNGGNDPSNSPQGTMRHGKL
jgi:hypothetical protein